MASVFLSYDHDDADRAAPIAAALEKAGHSVWWDQHIHGGAEYNSEIESAVEAADAVVVLWSEQSVKSAWVRDEAAEGRDQGKLVPALLDPVKPPMGFRQYQTIDLTQSKGRGRSSAPADLLKAIEALGKPTARDTGKIQSAPSSSRTVGPMLLAGIAAVVIATVILLWWQPWQSAGQGHRVAVMANDDSSASQSLAGTLLVQLGSLQAANADALHLVEPDSGANADLVLKVGALAGSSEPRAALSLIDNRSSTLLWSREFVQPGGNEADLRQQLAYSAGQVLQCATEALSPDHPKLELTTLKLYLNGCADLSNLIARDAAIAAATFRKVNDQAPVFAGGWAKLLIAQINAVRASQTEEAFEASRKDLKSYIGDARKIHPTLTEAYLAESWVQPSRPIIGWMQHTDEAVRRDPNHSRALEMHSLGMLHVGRQREAVSDARRAAQLNPLSPMARDSLIMALMESGAITAARNELRAVEQLWPGATGLEDQRFFLEYRFGDPKEALKLLESGKVTQIPAGAESFIRARIVPSAASVDRAIADARNNFRQNGDVSIYVQALATFGRTEDAIDTLLTMDPRTAPGIIVSLFRPHMSKVRRDPRFMEIARRFELIPYWQETGKWPDFCSEPDLPYDCKKEAATLAA